MACDVDEQELNYEHSCNTTEKSTINYTSTENAVLSLCSMNIAKNHWVHFITQIQIPMYSVCKQYTTQSHLKCHMQLHTGQFKHYCQTCRRGFNVDGHFKDHMMAHHGLPYKCGFCSKTFSSNVGYRHHLSLHTGEYRFKCDKCGKGYNDRKLFPQHENTHNESKSGKYVNN